MQSNLSRALLGVIIAAVAVVGFVAFSGGEDEDNKSNNKQPATTVGGSKPSKAETNPRRPAKAAPRIVVEDGEPKGGAAELKFNAGEEIEFSVTSDVADEIHVHGYDISKSVAAGGTASLSFPAELEGIFEVELEESAVPIAELTVNP